MASTPLTLAELERKFLAYLAQEVKAGRCSKRTHRYYQTLLDRFVVEVGGGVQAASLRAFDLECRRHSWHFVQAVQRLFSWAEYPAELLDRHPFKRVQRPPYRPRSRVLSRAEAVRLLRAARPRLRAVLLALLNTIARPQEVRSLRWSDLVEQDGNRAFVLGDFKGKARRKDGVAVRVILVTPRLWRLLERLRRRRASGRPEVFCMSGGQAWTANALQLAMRRLRRRCGLDGEGEPVVAYTLRHTAATRATAAGVRDKRLAELMGHASTRTTARYQHLQLGDLAEALQQATRRRRA